MTADTLAALTILRALHHELELYGPQFHMLPVELAHALATDQANVASLYCSLDWWGGSGSPADFIPDEANARRRIMQLLVDLVRAIDEIEIRCPRATHKRLCRLAESRHRLNVLDSPVNRV